MDMKLRFLGAAFCCNRKVIESLLQKRALRNTLWVKTEGIAFGEGALSPQGARGAFQTAPGAKLPQPNPNILRGKEFSGEK